MEDFCGDGLVFGKVGGFPQAFEKPLLTGEGTLEEAPVFLHPEHGIAAAAEGRLVLFQQSIHKGFQRGTIRPAAEHTGVGQQTSAQHHTGDLGKFLTERANLGQRPEIAVIA